MTSRRKFLIQVSLAAAVCISLTTSAPNAPAAQLATAIDYSYRRIMPGIASDGLD